MKIRDYALRKQRGFTLIEILVGMALSAILITGIVMTIFQVNIGASQTKNSMYALRQVQTAGYFISRDTLQATNIIPSGTNGFPLTLWWVIPGVCDWHKVEYTYDQTTRTLQREETTCGPPSTIQIAENIDPSISFTQNGTGYYILTLTAKVDGYQDASETRTYEIEPRVAGY